jgi:hypothetical protein
MRKVHISTFYNVANEMAGHILTKTLWDRLHWTTRSIFEVDGKWEIHLSRPKSISYEVAKKQALAILNAWIKNGCPTHSEIAASIRKRNATDFKGRRGARRVQTTWRLPDFDGGVGGSD